MDRWTRPLLLALVLVSCVSQSAIDLPDDSDTDTTGAAPPDTDDTADTDAPQSACTLAGSFIASGDWPSFTDWTFTFEADALVDSYTDDLPAEDWPTVLVRDPDVAGRITLEQTTEGGDATFVTLLRMDTACPEGTLALTLVLARTVFEDHTDDTVSEQDHEVTLHPATRR